MILVKENIIVLWKYTSKFSFVLGFQWADTSFKNDTPNLPDTSVDRKHLFRLSELYVKQYRK